MRTILFPFAVLAMTEAALACGPAPSCWLTEGREYLRDMCKNYTNDPKALKVLAENAEDPNDVPAFIKACKKLHINIKTK